MKKIAKEIQRVFLSLRLTIFLLVTIALVSIVGTLIPQQKEAGEYVEHYGEALYQLFDLFGLLNLFGSWWFELLLVLLMANLVACSLKRLPGMGALKSLTTTEKLGRLGPHATHFSLIIILAGSLIGNIWGFKAFVNIPEGESVNAVGLKNSSRMVKLDFTVRCDRFNISYYQDSKTPKEYRSDLAIAENGREVLSKTIRVNDPLKYKGISFYQSSYGMMPPRPGESRAELEIIPKGNGSKGYRLLMAEGETKEVPGTGNKVEFAAFIPDFALGQGNRISSKSDQPNNPAIQVNIYKNGKISYGGWSFLKYPEFHGSKDDAYRVKFLNYSGGGKPYTGLMVVKDPGVWVVWAGFGLLVLGLFFSFYFRRKSQFDKD